MCDASSPLTCAAGAVVNAGFSGMADSTGKAAGEMLAAALTWWTDTPTINPDKNPAVQNLQHYTLPVVALVLVGSVLAQSIQMTISRRKDPAVNIAVGLIRYAIVTSVGLALLGLAIEGFDAFGQQLLAQTIPDFANRFKGLLTGTVLTNPFNLFTIGALFWLLSAIQWILGFLRQAGILVLAVMLPLAASGSLNASTKTWLNKVVAWLTALVLYKFMAAMIYAIGFKLLGSGQDIQTAMTGLMVLILAVVALPVMMKFFSWGTSAASGGGVAGVLATGAMGAVALSQLSSGAGGAVQSAANMDRSGPGSNSSGAPPTGAGPGSGAPSGGGPTGPGPSGGGGSAGGGPTTGGIGGSGASASSAGGPAATGAAAAGAGSAGRAAGTAGSTGAAGAAAGSAAAAGAAAGPVGAAAALAQGARGATQATAQQFGDTGGQQ
jgi:type IV secretion system protein TrbL